MNLEVIISEKKNRYIAKTPSFPKCVGIGKNEAEALNKLKRSISRYIASQTEETLDTLFATKNYNEVITDPFQKQPVQHRIYDLLQQKLPIQKNVLMKFNTLKELKDLKKEEEPQSVEAFFDALKTEQKKFSESQIKESTISVQETPLQTQDDGFIFGIPLSLN
jgi:predicted RNase H-like HicB family nuclease